MLTLSEANYNASTHTITASGTTQLPVGEYEITFKGLVLKLADGVTSLQTNNTATVTGDGITDQTATSQNLVLSRYADIAKTAALITLSGTDNPATGGVPAIEDTGTASAPVLTALGQVVEYRLKVTNHASGGLVSGSVIVTDVVPDGTTLVPGSITHDESAGYARPLDAVAGEERQHFDLLSLAQFFDRVGLVAGQRADTELVDGRGAGNGSIRQRIAEELHAAIATVAGAGYLRPSVRADAVHLQ